MVALFHLVYAVHGLNQSYQLHPRLAHATRYPDQFYYVVADSFSHALQAWDTRYHLKINNAGTFRHKTGKPRALACFTNSSSPAVLTCKI